jgi:hypothetical protein
MRYVARFERSNEIQWFKLIKKPIDNFPTIVDDPDPAMNYNQTCSDQDHQQ